MPIMPIHVIQDKISLDELLEEVAKLQKVSRYLLNGQIDFENIRARSIKAQNIEVETITANELSANSVSTDKLQAGAVTADKITVAELSAISADLGHITAGLVEAITMIASTITGSLIQTAEAGSYPRVELSSTANLLKAEYEAGSSVEIRPDATTGNPGLRFDKGLAGATISTDSVGLDDYLKIASNPGLTHILINSGIDLLLRAFGSVTVEDWSKFKNDDSGQTLQQALDSKANTFTGISGGTPAGASLIFSNGICVGYV